MEPLQGGQLAATYYFISGVSIWRGCIDVMGNNQDLDICPLYRCVRYRGVFIKRGSTVFNETHYLYRRYNCDTYCFRSFVFTDWQACGTTKYRIGNAQEQHASQLRGLLLASLV